MLAEEECSQIKMEELQEAVQKIQLEKNQYIYYRELLKGGDDNILSCGQKKIWSGGVYSSRKVSFLKFS